MNITLVQAEYKPFETIFCPLSPEEFEKLRQAGIVAKKRVFDTCAYIEISTSLENRAFFIEKMSNFPQSLVRNFA